ncbi:MAG: response regulator [Polyangiaceae bacterium]
MSRSSAREGVRRPTVLIADDDDDMRAAVADLLREERQLDVVEAADGAEALEIALTTRLDAIVLDQRMPRLTGVEVVGLLRARSVRVPIILVTAARDVRELAADLGLRCYLAKPFSADEIVEQLTRALEGEGG